jgi:hypothetical protein
MYTQEGTIQSPSWPRNYGSDLYCIYKIVCGDDEIIQLRFQHFETAGATDYVELDDGVNVITYVQRYMHHEKVLNLFKNWSNLLITVYYKVTILIIPSRIMVFIIVTSLPLIIVDFLQTLWSTA